MHNAGGLTQMELLKLGEQLRDETVVGQKLGLYAQGARDGELAQLFRSHQARQQRHVQVLQSYVARARQPGAAVGPSPGAWAAGPAPGGVPGVGAGPTPGEYPGQAPGPGMATAPTYGRHTGPTYGGQTTAEPGRGAAGGDRPGGQGWRAGGPGQPWTAGEARLGAAGDRGGDTSYGYAGGIATAPAFGGSPPGPTFGGYPGSPGYGNDTGYAWAAGPAPGPGEPRRRTDGDAARYEVGDIGGDAGDGDRRRAEEPAAGAQDPGWTGPVRERWAGAPRGAAEAETGRKPGDARDDTPDGETPTAWIRGAGDPPAGGRDRDDE